MVLRRLRIPVSFVFFCSLAQGACSSESDGYLFTGDSGGADGVGGAAPTGGTSSGGTSAMTGGSSGSGGSSQTSGGTTATGGTSASGGTSGTGGSTDGVGGVVNGCNGWASRYWDCCKQHCGWADNTPSKDPITSCSFSDSPVADDVGSACSGGSAYTCHAMAPWAVSSTLSYGFAAVQHTGDVCGRCYQIQFTGSSHNAGSDPGSAAIAGKSMIVQVTNVGGVAGDQFDLLIPGGGVGDFDACTQQWQTSDLGERYGGFLGACRSAGSHSAVKSCVAQRCQNVFGSKGLTKLYNGCMWFVDWLEVADNPNFKFMPVTCPAALTNASGMRGATPAGGC
jgi:hypothetical protein